MTLSAPPPRSLNDPPASTIPDLLDRQLESRPEAVALAAPGRTSATYRDLAANVADISARLSEAGIRRADRVAVVLPNGPEMAAAFLGVARSAICAPLNPAYRRPEFDFLLGDLGARALLLPAGSESPARAAAESRGISILEVSPQLETPAGRFRLSGSAQGSAALDGSPRAEDAALILYTSGMTSRPKAVLLSHGEICTSAHNIAVALKLTPDDCCLNVMPLFHAHGLIIATLSSLMAGASVVSTPGLAIPDFFEWLMTFRPTWYTSAPTIHQAILENAATRTAPAHRLRFIRSSAAFLPSSVKAGLEREFGCPVIEAYGMTECTQITSNPLAPGRRRAGSVGVAAGPSVAIVDETGTRLPAGKAGEIVIQGPPVTQGYDRNPEANASSFERGWFRTGDQGVLSEDGFLSLTGRLKDIINCGGEKLSPSEVDEVLMRHPAVLEAVAFAVPHATLGEDVAAAVVLRPGASASETELRQFAAASLAEYKVPSQFVLLPEIPKGPTGKLLRVGLAQTLGLAPSMTEDAHRVGESPPGGTGSVEAPLAKIWCELLKVERAEPGGNFFRLGGDSIRASLLVARVRKDFRVELPLRALFDTPTFEEICQAVEAGRGKAPARAPVIPRARPAAVVESPPHGPPPPVEAPAAFEPPKPVPTPRGALGTGTEAPLQFSLFFFSADGSADSPEKYRLVLEASRFADQHGYAAVWTPERHFHSFGGLYPNPAVVGAAIAAVTNRIQIRAASVVLPLQNPIRVAEEWSVVDNLSHGRVGVSFASGWHVNDFALSPSTYANRRSVMFDRIQTVRDLWAGRSVRFPNGAGIEIDLTTYPRPVQRSLPIWLSCQSDATFEKAGEIGANIITSMFLMSVAELAPKIGLYRRARARYGHEPATGQVTVSLHTFLGEHMDTVREKVGGAYLDYLLVNLGLQSDRVRGSGEDFAPSEEDRDFLTRQATERLFNERGLVGTVASCQDRVATLRAIGVDEITCLIDFGIDFDSIMSSLYQLNRLKDLSAREVPSASSASR